MSSIFADQYTPMSQNASGGGEGGVAGSLPIRTAVHIT